PLNPAGPGLDVSGRGIVQSCLFAIGQLNMHFGCEDEGDFVLDGENIVQGAVVTFGPEMRTVYCVDQLRRDPDAVPALANAALQNVSHAELLRRLANIDRTTLVNEARIACDDAQA